MTLELSGKKNPTSTRIFFSPDIPLTNKSSKTLRKPQRWAIQYAVLNSQNRKTNDCNSYCKKKKKSRVLWKKFDRDLFSVSKADLIAPTRLICLRAKANPKGWPLPVKFDVWDHIFCL